jgi:polyribonucleotide nucleotidyltransferase
VLPEYEQFPYTIRLVSEVLESNGSSSMASVCGGTLALLDAGVPIRAPVAGVAMGLVEEEGRFHVVTDILGDEDHYGDMDFKVAGTAQGITALQMDLKRHGVPFEVMRRALEQARAARLHVLAEMAKTLSAPRTNIAEHAPKIIQLKVPVDKIGKLIGPGGKMIRGLEEKYGVTIDVADDGSVVVASPKRDQAGQCVVEIEGLTGTPEVGKVYLGEVVNIREFGVFLEILPGTDGMCHVSELDTAYVKDPTEFCKVGDKLEVKLISIDDMGRLKLSRKALLLERSGQAPAAPGDGQAAQAQPAGAPVGVERRTPGGMSGEERKKWLDREQAGGRERGGRGGGRRGGGGGGRGGGRGGPPRNGG